MHSNEGAEQAAWLAAVGEPTRIAIIRALVAGRKTVIELSRSLAVEKSNVSNHLQVMRGAGVVESERVGRIVINSLLGANLSGAGLELTHPSGAKVLLPMS